MARSFGEVTRGVCIHAGTQDAVTQPSLVEGVLVRRTVARANLSLADYEENARINSDVAPLGRVQTKRAA